VDVVKAVGILTVVWIHSLEPIWMPDAPFHAVWWAHVTRFAVPGFLAASGYLYASEGRLPAGITRRRLARILVPYTAATLAAELFWALRGEPRWGVLHRDLAFGAAFGAYYYVPQIVLLVLLSPLFARLRGRVLALVGAAALVGQGLVEAAVIGADLEPFWTIRNPLRWAAYFLVGWQLCLHREAVLAWLAPRRRRIALGAALVLALCACFPAAHGGPAGPRLAGWTGVYAALALLYAASAGRPATSSGIRALSDATYPVYLLHLFFVIPLAAALEPWLGSGAWHALGVWAGGVLGSLAAIAVLRRLLGDRARLLLGA
jgi:surface polysaccharide O-acyltransferase-like enzyme